MYVRVLHIHPLPSNVFYPQKSSGAAALRSSYLRVIHLERSSPGGTSSAGNPFGVQFTPEEEEEFAQMARSEGFYERFVKSIAPSIFGSHGMLCLDGTTGIASVFLADCWGRHQEGHRLPTVWRFEENPS